MSLPDPLDRYGTILVSLFPRKCRPADMLQLPRKAEVNRKQQKGMIRCYFLVSPAAVLKNKMMLPISYHKL
jgi:hypothetical protein